MIRDDRDVSSAGRGGASGGVQVGGESCRVYPRPSPLPLREVGRAGAGASRRVAMTHKTNRPGETVGPARRHGAPPPRGSVNDGMVRVRVVARC